MTTPEGWKQALYLEPSDLKELHTTFEYWLYLGEEDIEVLDVVLAAALDRDIPGDPFWLYLVAPSGGIKTEFVRALNKYPPIYTIDTLTVNTFISGKVEKDKETGEIYPVAGILDQLDGKVLVIKDFTVVLSSLDATRTEIYGQLRAIHDGYFEKGFGTLKEPIRVTARIGLIVAVTPAIDRYTKAHNLLGERFLKARLHPESQKTAERAFKNLGQEEKMREDLSTATAYYLNRVRSTRPFPRVTGQQMKDLIQIARYIALMRTRIMGRYHQGLLVEPYLTEPEVPTRVVKQLKKLAIGLALVRQHNVEVTEEDMKTIKRMAKDCSIPVRQKIVDGLGTFLDEKGALVFELQETTKLPRNTINNELIKMQLLGIVEVTEIIGEEKSKKKQDDLEYYNLTKDFRELYGISK